VAAADEPERHGAVERAGAGKRGHGPSAGVREPRLREALLRNRSGADEAVLGLEEDVDARRHVVRDQRRNADAEVDEHAVAKLAGDAFCDDGLRVHVMPP
jgi:hypothetical protein